MIRGGCRKDKRKKTSGKKNTVLNTARRGPGSSKILSKGNRKGKKKVYQKYGGGIEKKKKRTKSKKTVYSGVGGPQVLF